MSLEDTVAGEAGETEFDESSAIAIVGMAGRFPKAPNIDVYWQNIRDARECLTRYSDAELEEAGEDPSRVALPGYVKVGGPLEKFDQFDAGFFGFSPRDASILDPQHRHILECAWESLENAAIDPETFDGSIGVFAGSGHNAYLPYNILTNPHFLDSVGFFLLRHTGNDKDFLATRISYCLNLRGPSVNIQTACSTSLVAIHQASQSLLNSECDMALAGGVTIEFPHHRGYLYEEGEILSPDGHCRAFDADSKGTLFGSAAGMVALRRYSDAAEAGDIIHGVILGSAINNDGANKVGYLAPSVDGQASCVAEALLLSEVPAETISYIECHGTGTPVGDPIEVAALTQAFREETEEEKFCGIGSVKTNIGHTDTAAGVASLIKTVQAMKHRQLPPSLHFKTPNPQIEFDTSPFYVNTELTPWKNSVHPRRAGINSLGVGGTNAFVVVEEAPERQGSGGSRARQIVTLSARSEQSLDRASARLADALGQRDSLKLADVAYTLGVGRRDFDFRRMVVANDRADAAQVLADGDATRVFTQRAQKRSVAFAFPGGGAQYPQMGFDLYQNEDVYRDAVDYCLGELKKKVDWDLKPLLFPAAGEEEAAGEKLQDGSKSLTSLFITEYALAKLYMSWGVKPEALIGHSMGEYVAACLAGVFTVEEGLRLVLVRGQLFEKVEAGAMLSTSLSVAELKPLLGEDLDIAVVNGPSAAVASGPVAAIEALKVVLDEKDVQARRVRINVAAHSRMLDPVLEEFRQVCKGVDFKKPEIPLLSNVSGGWMTDAEAMDPDYWVRHLRNTVQVSSNLETLLEDPERIVLEVAPGRTMASLTRAHPSAGLGRPVFSSLRDVKEEVSDLDFLLDVLGRLWLCGVEVDWNAFYSGETRQRVELPTYAFDHQRYWIEPGKSQIPLSKQSLKKKPDLADWFYQPTFKRQPLPTMPSFELAGLEKGEAKNWLLFVDDSGLGEALALSLKQAGQNVLTVTPGESFAAKGDSGYQVSTESDSDYDDLWGALEERSLLPHHIFYLWALDTDDSKIGPEDVANKYPRTFYGLLHLAQAMGKAGHSDPLNLIALSNGAQQVAGEALTHPEQATLMGPVKVIPRELSSVVSCCIDVVLPSAGSWQLEHLSERLVQEALVLNSDDDVIAYRGHDRFVRRYEPIDLSPAEAAHSRLKAGGVYLITGGLGGLGLALSRHLSSSQKAKLVLVGRSELPERGRWSSYLAGEGDDEKIRRKLQQIQQLEEAGAEVLVLAADVTRLEDMQRVAASAKDRFGGVDGIFHTAGVLDDGIVQLKSRESAAAVLAPKVQGTLVIDAAFKELEPCFTVYFSSMSSLKGLQGQVDYAAANAFLDAFAQAKTTREGTLNVAINWGVWQSVGMAAELARDMGLSGKGVAERSARHVLLDRCLKDSATEREYLTTFSAEDHWLLDEHRIKGGEALIPGTGYLEIARAALEEHPLPDHRVEIRDFSFHAPFVVPANSPSEMHVRLKREDGGWNLEVHGEQGGVHAAGHVAYIPAGPSVAVSLAEISQRCSKSEETFDSAADTNLDFGPRWNNRQRIRFGDKEALLSLELPSQFVDDLVDYPLHPALMDFATAGAQSLIPGYSSDKDFYVPLSYGSLQITAPLKARIHSHIRLSECSDQIASYDLAVYDDEGNELVSVKDFVMRRIEDRTVMSQSIDAAAPEQASSGSSQKTTANKLLELGLEEGISPEEGMAALDRILAGPLTAQTIVSSQDLEALMASTGLDDPDQPKSASGDGPALAGSALAPRPPLPTAYVAPETDLAKTIAGLWGDLLGVEGIGIHDDFFDLGGHSLLLTQLLSRLRKQAKADLSLRSLFEKRTIAGIADEIEKARSAGPKKAKPMLKRVSRDRYRIKKPTE